MLDLGLWEFLAAGEVAGNWRRLQQGCEVNQKAYWYFQTRELDDEKKPIPLHGFRWNVIDIV
jgi:hypothetical protein